MHKWKLRRQLRILMYFVAFCLFCVWGGFLCYFVYVQEECASSAPSIYRLALLLLLVFFVLVGLAILLFTCVCLDCCFSGRMRLVLLLSDDPSGHNPAPSNAQRFLVGATTERSAPLASEAPELNRTSTLFTKASDKQDPGRQLLVANNV